MFEVASVNCHYRKLFLQDIFQLTQIQWCKSVLYLSFMRNEAFGEVVEINRFKDVNDFVKITGNLDCEVVIESEDRKYRVDGKSILGIYSLDLSMLLILSVPETEEDKFFKYRWFEEED